MRKACLFLLALTSLSALAHCQNTPQWELFGGGQYTNADTGALQDEVNAVTQSYGLPPVDIGRHQNGYGWNFSLQENSKSWWGGVFDLSGSYETKNIDLTQQLVAGGIIPPGSTANLRAKPSAYTFAFGPQFTYRPKRIQPFVRIMFGAAHARETAALFVNKALFFTAPKETDTAFAFFGGGGTDYVLKDYLSLRVVGDYVRTYLFNDTQNNFRVSVGLNFRIGRK
jgi:hypothetical protein